MTDDDFELAARIRGALERHPVPTRPVGRNRRPALLPRILIGFAAVAFVLAAGGLGQALVTFRSEVAASTTPNPQLPKLRSNVQRAEAIALARSLDLIGRVDRIDAKLMTFDEYVRVAGPVRTRLGDPQAPPVTGFGIEGDPTQRIVWVVAVSGEVWPQGKVPVFFNQAAPPSPTPYPPYGWGLILIDASSGQFMVIGDAGVGASWPSIFSALPSHPSAP